jgi:hypothetical protein
VNTENLLQPLGLIAITMIGGALLLALGAAFILGVLIIGALCLLEWLHSRRLLGGIAFGLLLAAVVMHFSGCTTPPVRDPRDPEIWHPTSPAYYPLPR